MVKDMKNDKGSPLVKDKVRSKAILTEEANKLKAGKRWLNALLCLYDRGFLNVFEDGTFSLTESARPVAEALNKDDRQCKFWNEGECLIDLRGCRGSRNCKRLKKE